MFLVLDKAKRGESAAHKAGRGAPETPASTLAALSPVQGGASRGRTGSPGEIATPDSLAAAGDRQLDVGLLAHPVDSTTWCSARRRTRLGGRVAAASPLARKQSRLSGPQRTRAGVFPRADRAPGRYDAVLLLRAAGFDPSRQHASNPEFAMGWCGRARGRFDLSTVARWDHASGVATLDRRRAGMGQLGRVAGVQPAPAAAHFGRSRPKC